MSWWKARNKFFKNHYDSPREKFNMSERETASQRERVSDSCGTLYGSTSPFVRILDNFKIPIIIKNN